MYAPFYKYGMFGDEVSLIVAFVIGIGFGFFLERAGFGSARKLAAQFYFTDMAVLKVMFTAIITAMTGLYLLARVGFVDLSMVYLVPTFVVPQIVGGLLLGVGFVIGGYCPGTSCVSAASGRVDGMVYIAGMFAGLLVFGEISRPLEGFLYSTPLGQVTLPAFFHLPYGVLVLAVVLMALVAFAVAEWAEKKTTGTAPDAEGSLTAMPWRLTPVRRLAGAFAVAGVLAVVLGNPYRGNTVEVDTRDLALGAARAQPLAPAKLADWIIQGRNDFTLVDLRTPASYGTYHIPGAQNVPLASLTADVAPRNQTLVLCTDDGAEAAQAWFLLKAEGFRSVYLLAGGLNGWRDQVLYPKAGPETSANDVARLSQVAQYFGGTPQTGVASAAAPPMPVLAPPVAPPIAPAGGTASPKKKKEGC